MLSLYYETVLDLIIVKLYCFVSEKQTFLQFSFSAFSDRHFMTLRCMCPYFQDELDVKLIMKVKYQGSSIRLINLTFLRV